MVSPRSAPDRSDSTRPAGDERDASGSRSKAHGALLGLAVFLVPLAVLVADGRYLGSGDCVPAELLPISLLGDGDLAFDEFVSPGRPLPYWFQRVGGRVLSFYPILPGLLNVPVYAAARLAGVSVFEHRQLLSLLTSALLVAASVYFLFRCLGAGGSTRRQSLFFAGAYFFGTLVWSVAGKALFQHAPSLFFLTGALWLLAENRPAATALAGLALSFAVVNRPPNALIALPLALFAFRHRRSGFAGFCALAAIPAALLGLYGWKYFGTPFTLGEPIGVRDFDGRWSEGLAGLLLSPSRGLFVFSPFLLFAVPAAVMAFRRGEPALERSLVIAVALVLALFSLWGRWWGGQSFGYRILIELVPLLVLILARQWPRLGAGKAARVAFGFLLAASVAVQVLGVSAYPSDFNADIDREPWRVWSISDSELAMDVKKLLAPRSSGAGTGNAGAGGRESLVAPPKPVWWTPEANDDSVAGSLDWPREGSYVPGDLVIRGWAADPRGMVDVQPLATFADSIPPVTRHARPDVCRARSGLGDCGRIGFWTELPGRSGTVRRYALVVELRDRRGRVRRLGPVRFWWKGGKEPDLDESRASAGRIP